MKEEQLNLGIKVPSEDGFKLMNEPDSQKQFNQTEKTKKEPNLPGLEIQKKLIFDKSH